MPITLQTLLQQTTTTYFLVKGTATTNDSLSSSRALTLSMKPVLDKVAIKKQIAAARRSKVNRIIPMFWCYQFFLDTLPSRLVRQLTTSEYKEGAVLLYK